VKPESFPKEERVRKSDEFTRILEEGRRVRGRILTAYWRVDAEESTEPNRVGVAAGKRLGNAVVRNRLKRLVREAYRRNKRELPCRGVSIVFLASRGTIGKSFEEVRDDLVTILHTIAARVASSSPR
jgi:ribonuclease P protein component